MKFQVTHSYSWGDGLGYGNSYGDGSGNGSGYGYGYDYGHSYGYGYNYGYGYGSSNGCAQVNDHIHPVVSADPDLRVAIQTAALQPLLHLEEL